MQSCRYIIDLHVHSTASDGSLSPAQVAELGKAKNLSAIALTDHDTMAGVAECQKRGEEIGLEVIPGVEMSCVYREQEIHILGYLLPPGFPKNTFLHAQEIFSDLAYFARERENRNAEILRRFERDGIHISREDLLEGSTPNTQITRAHFAKALVKMGLVKERKEAFEYYLVYGGSYIPVKTVTIEKTMDFFKKHGFFISLAHPLQYGFPQEELEELLGLLKEMGMQGMETYYSAYDEAQTAFLLDLSRKYSLIKTGGSDFHGVNKPGLELGTGYGGLKVPGLCLEEMKKGI